MTLTRADVVARVALATGSSRGHVDIVTQRMFCLLGEALENGETVKLTGFATLEVRSRAERIGRNPKTGEVHAISARRAIHIVPGAKLREKLATPRHVVPE